MKVFLVVAVCVVSACAAEASGQSTPRAVGVTQPANEKIAEAYDQFILARHFESADDLDAAIAAYKRAIELDPEAADIQAELAGFYLRQNHVQDAMLAAEQAVKIDPDNGEANRVLGLIYSALAESTGTERAPGDSDENATKAIRYLEIAIAQSEGDAEPSTRATLARLYISSGAFGKAIPLLVALTTQEPQWQDGPLLLAQAYSGAGRTADGIAFLEDRASDDPRLLPTLADFYEHERRWQEAADTYEKALRLMPFGRNTIDLRTRYASALLNVGSRDAAEKARDVLVGDGAAAKRGGPVPPPKPPLPTDSRALYLLSQAERRLGDLQDAESAARALVARNAQSPWGYYALAETLEERGQYREVVGALEPAMAQFRPQGASDDTFDASMLLPHLGFAYQQLGQFDKAIATFEEARKLTPEDPALAGYLAEANIAAKKYGPAAEIAHAALAVHPDDLRLARVNAQALRLGGKTDQAIALMQDLVAKHADSPAAHIALAGVYADANRSADAVQVLQRAEAKFPSDNTILFELGAVLDKQKRFAESEIVFKQIIARDPQDANALNYLGYMLAERGERLDESVGLVTRALEIEPDNGSFLDSLGWAYFKADKLGLAEENLRRAAEQLQTNSVIQDHYGDVLFKLHRFDEAIDAWTRALAGDGDSIDRKDIDKKIHDARQQIKK